MLPKREGVPMSWWARFWLMRSLEFRMGVNEIRAWIMGWKLRFFGFRIRLLKHRILVAQINEQRGKSCVIYKGLFLFLNQRVIAFSQFFQCLYKAVFWP